MPRCPHCTARRSWPWFGVAGDQQEVPVELIGRVVGVLADAARRDQLDHLAVGVAARGLTASTCSALRRVLLVSVT